MTTIINDIKVVEVNESDNTLVISTVEKNLIVGDGVKTVTDGTTTVSAPDTIKFVGATVTTTRAGEAIVTTSGGTAAGLTFSDDGANVGVFSEVDFKGNGVSAVDNGGKLEVTIDTPSSAPTLALHFAGIYDTISHLESVIPKPSSNMQAIITDPIDAYYHSVGGSWVELAPVGAFHPTFLGTFDTVSILEQAEPNPKDDDLAIVGTSSKSFFVYNNGAWSQLTHTDLPALDARVTDAEGKIQALQQDNVKQDGEIKALQGRSDTPKFDPAMFQSAVDHGYATDDQGIKSTTTTDGWWLFKDLKSVSGRPADSIGDLIIFKNTIDTNNVALKHAFVMAIGQDKDLESKVWFMYRDGTSWTSWFDQIGSEQSVIDGIKSDIVKLKAGDSSLVSEVGQLTSNVGGIYAPTKLAFNKAVTALISAALANYTPAKPGHGGDKPSLVFPRFYAQFSLGVPVDFTGATTSTNAEATLLRIPTTRERIFISIANDNDEASKVTGFKFNNKQEMSLAHRDIVRDGKKYRTFYTSGAFSEQKVDIKVDFGQGI